VSSVQADLSIFEKFDFKYPPVGMKFLFHKPDGIEQIDINLPFCETVREAQQGRAPFYFTKENETCVGKFLLGMEDIPPGVQGGHIGPKIEVFKEARANSRLYYALPRFQRGLYNYVAVSALDKMTFDPDVLVLLATPSQAEIVLRAMSYSTGEIWEPKGTPVVGCAWLFIHPYQSGKVNFMVTGLDFGMKAKESYPEGWILISIPWNWIPIITQNLKEIKWVLPSYEMGREKFVEFEVRAFVELAQEFQNP
jgi:uncharacterized protein (DUF169 family)